MKPIPQLTLFSAGLALLSLTAQAAQVRPRVGVNIRNGNIHMTTQEYSEFESRCTALGDSLESGQSSGRLEWALRCAQSKYEESTFSIADNSYYEVLIPILRSVKKYNTDHPGGRFHYPTYGVLETATGEIVNPAAFRAPLVVDGSCDLPPNYGFAAVCVEGCFSNSQTVLFEQGESNITSAKIRGWSKVLGLSQKASLEAIEMEPQDISHFVETLGIGEQEVLNIETQAGRRLSVTTNHPVLLATGMMVEASTLGAGQLLLADDGSPDEILALSTSSYIGKVYNVRISSDQTQSHIVSAGGLLNGSIYFQNEGVEHLNRLLFRINAPSQL